MSIASHGSKLFLGVLFGLSSFFLFDWSFPDKRLDVASKSYQEGEQAATVALREDSFNRSLAFYLALAQSYPVEEGNGELYFAIANCYFQLGQYPWAVLFYRKALKCTPGNSVAAENLEKSFEVMGGGYSWQRQWISAKMWWQLFACCATFAFLFSSAALYRNWKVLWGIAVLGMIGAVVACGGAFYLFLQQEPRAIVLEASFLQQEPYDTAPSVDLIRAGSEVILLQLQGGWALLRLTHGGKEGYVKASHIASI